MSGFSCVYLVCFLRIGLPYAQAGPGSSCISSSAPQCALPMHKSCSRGYEDDPIASDSPDPKTVHFECVCMWIFWGRSGCVASLEFMSKGDFSRSRKDGSTFKSTDCSSVPREPGLKSQQPHRNAQSVICGFRESLILLGSSGTRQVLAQTLYMQTKHSCTRF